MTDMILSNVYQGKAKTRKRAKRRRMALILCLLAGLILIVGAGGGSKKKPDCYAVQEWQITSRIVVE